MAAHDVVSGKTCIDSLKEAIEELARMQTQTDDLLVKLRRELAHHEEVYALTVQKPTAR